MAFIKSIWNANFFLPKSHPLKHSKVYGFIYSINYEFIHKTIAPDQGKIDAYLLGVFDPIDEFKGCCITIIHKTNDDDNKLVVAPKILNYSDEQIKALTEFQERFYESDIIG